MNWNGITSQSTIFQVCRNGSFLGGQDWTGQDWIGLDNHVSFDIYYHFTVLKQTCTYDAQQNC